MSDEPDATEAPEQHHPADDGGAALRRAQESIREAEKAEDEVAAHDDITTLDAQRAGEYSEDPDGTGGT